MLERVYKKLARVALFFFLVTVTPAVYAMAQVEPRYSSRAIIVQFDNPRRRKRALTRHYGAAVTFDEIFV